MKPSTDNVRALTRILIISSDAEISALWRQLLEAPDRSVEVRAGASASLDYLQQQTVDLVVLHVEGTAAETELMRQIQQCCPQTRLVMASCPSHNDATDRAVTTLQTARHRLARYGAPCQLAHAASAR